MGAKGSLAASPTQAAQRMQGSHLTSSSGAVGCLGIPTGSSAKLAQRLRLQGDPVCQLISSPDLGNQARRPNVRCWSSWRAPAPSSKLNMETLVCKEASQPAHKQR